MLSASALARSEEVGNLGCGKLFLLGLISLEYQSIKNAIHIVLEPKKEHQGGEPLVRTVRVCSCSY